jgi:hypothetical protein
MLLLGVNWQKPQNKNKQFFFWLTAVSRLLLEWEVRLSLRGFILADL